MKRLFFILLLIAPWAGLAQTYDKGRIIDTVFCSANHSQSYALYLPSDYRPDKHWPIIYIFEPAARGALPLNIFEKSAEELGYILVSSNNSKNGDWSVVFAAARAMKKDTESKFTIDANQIYTAGFSGGSRAAMVMAKSVFNARGIIANAGAYPSKNQYLIKRKDSIAYAAIVGNRDMNFLEHKQLAKSLTDQQIDNLLIITSEPHHWASSNEVFLAMQWMELKTNKNLSLNNKKRILDNIRIWGDSTLNQPSFIYALPLFQQLSNEYAISFSKNPHELLESKSVQKQLKFQQRIEAKEDQQLKNYMEVFTSLYQTQLNPALDSIYTKEGWRSEIDKLHKKERSEKENVVLSSLRISNYIWASFAEISFSYASKGNYIFALELNELWQYAQPESAWAMYSQAKIYVKLGDNSAAIKALYKAKELGMVSKENLINEPVFQQLQGLVEYQLLLTLLE